MALGKSKTKLPKDVEKRIERGRERLQQIASKRDEAFAFYRGDHYAYVDENNVLQMQPTTTTVQGTGKARWRARTNRNLIFDIVLHETSAASQRVPSYQVVPATSDPDDIAAARLAEKVALYGYERWDLRQATVYAVMHAIIGGEAFAWPFFDNTVGRQIEGEGVAEGDVKVRIFGGNECFWEPGLPFERSPYHVVEHARPKEELERMADYYGGTLNYDADSRALSGKGKNTGDRKLVMATEYLERPCPEYPRGRWITIANNRQIVPEKPYPGEDLVLRKLSYATDPDSDRDLGLVPQLLDAQRSFNDSNNKAAEWTRLCLVPRIFATPGLFRKQRWTDEPGKVYEIPQPEQNIKVVDVPRVPNELFDMADRAIADMGRIAAQNDIPQQVESGKGIQALLEKDHARRQSFIADLAQWHSRVMHDCLGLVQRHYTEPRLVQIKGDFGWESLHAFRGSDLRGQVDVRVFPESIEPRTKQAIEQRIMNYAQMGWIGPEQAMTAMEQGTADTLARSLAQDEARAGRIIQRIKEGEEALSEMPEMPTGRTNPDGSPETAPGWMPRHSDNLPVFRAIFEEWMKTEEFERLDPEMQYRTALIYSGIQMLEAQKAQEAQMAQMAEAEQHGLANASRPQGDKPHASLPSLNGEAQGTPA